jgi:hypothetical protein
VVVWACGVACLTALLFLQSQVLASPVDPTLAYEHAVNFKGGTFYLSEPLYTVWTTLNVLAIPLIFTGILLINRCNTLEQRTKRLLWDAALGELVERSDTHDTTTE